MSNELELISVVITFLLGAGIISGLLLGRIKIILRSAGELLLEAAQALEDNTITAGELKRVIEKLLILIDSITSIKRLIGLK